MNLHEFDFSMADENGISISNGLILSDDAISAYGRCGVGVGCSGGGGRCGVGVGCSGGGGRCGVGVGCAGE